MTMFYNFNNSIINVNEISSVYQSSSENTEYPFSLKIFMKDGMIYSVNYATEKGCKQEVDALTRFISPPVLELVTCYDIERIVSKQIEKIRRDIKNLRKKINDNEL